MSRLWNLGRVMQLAHDGGLVRWDIITPSNDLVKVNKRILLWFMAKLLRVDTA